MMRKVNPDDIEAWLAGLFLKGTLPSEKHFYWHPGKVDIPLLEVQKEVSQDGNVTMIRHSLKVKFNKHGRAQKLYKEWPMAIHLVPYQVPWYANKGLAITEGDALEPTVVTFISGNDTGQAVYRQREKGAYIYVLDAYEGTVK